MKTYTITVNGNVYDVTVEEGEQAQGAGAVNTADKAKAPQAKPAAKPAAAQSAGSIKINAPMPGKIIAIKAKVGDTVKKDEVVIVLEAMKMENEIVTPSDGTVASINVAVGDNVEAGAVLASLN